MEKGISSRKVKLRNIIVLLAQFVVTVMLVIPGTITTEVWDAVYGNAGVQRLEITYQYSFLNQCIDKNSLIGYLTMAVALACLVFCVLQFIGKGDKRNSMLAAFTPVVEFVLIVIAVITFSGSEMYGNKDIYGIPETEYREFPGVIFYAYAAILLIMAVVSVVTYLKIAKAGIVEEEKAPVKVKVVESTVSISNADELKKYKDLLDSGVISQEEFDAKKKQLLGV